MKPLFSRSHASAGRASIVKGWSTEGLNLSDAYLIWVVELACHEPGCPPIETVMTAHGADGQRRTWWLHKPLARMAAADVAALEAQP